MSFLLFAPGTCGSPCAHSAQSCPRWPDLSSDSPEALQSHDADCSCKGDLISGSPYIRAVWSSMLRLPYWGCCVSGALIMKLPPPISSPLLSSHTFHVVSLSEPPSTCNISATVVMPLCYCLVSSCFVLNHCGSVRNHVILVCIWFIICACVWKRTSVSQSLPHILILCQNINDYLAADYSEWFLSPAGFSSVVCGRSQLHICHAGYCPIQTDMFWRGDCGCSWNVNYMLQVPSHKVVELRGCSIQYSLV